MTEGTILTLAGLAVNLVVVVAKMHYDSLSAAERAREGVEQVRATVHQGVGEVRSHLEQQDVVLRAQSEALGEAKELAKTAAEARPPGC